MREELFGGRGGEHHKLGHCLTSACGLLCALRLSLVRRFLRWKESLFNSFPFLDFSLLSSLTPTTAYGPASPVQGLCGAGASVVGTVVSALGVSASGGQLCVLCVLGWCWGC